MDTRVLLCGLLCGIAVANSDIQENLQNLNINGIPNNIDLSNITNSINQEEVENALKKKCRDRSGSDEAYEKAKQTLMDSKACIDEILNFEQINEEVERAKPTGDLDVVFKKYCMQTPAIKKCVYNAANSIEPCLEAGEVETKNTGINVTDSLIDFICHKDGDRIACKCLLAFGPHTQGRALDLALRIRNGLITGQGICKLFIAEGGPECLNSSLPAIRTCVEANFNLTMGDQMPSLESLPLLMLNTDDCGKFVSLQKCIVKKLDECPETTPGNVVESLFNFIKKHTPCKGYQAALTEGNGATTTNNPIQILFSITLSLGALALTHY